MMTIASIGGNAVAIATCGGRDDFGVGTRVVSSGRAVAAGMAGGAAGVTAGATGAVGAGTFAASVTTRMKTMTPPPKPWSTVAFRGGRHGPRVRQPAAGVPSGKRAPLSQSRAMAASAARFSPERNSATVANAPSRVRCPSGRNGRDAPRGVARACSRARAR